MALINCPECQKEISDKVKECPQCGFPFDKDKGDWNKFKDLNELKPAVKTGMNILAIFLWVSAIVSIIGFIISVQLCNAVSF